MHKVFLGLAEDRGNVIIEGKVVFFMAMHDFSRISGENEQHGPSL